MAILSRFHYIVLSLAIVWAFPAEAKPPQLCYCPCPTTEAVVNLKDPSIDPIRLQNWITDAAILSFHYDYSSINDWISHYSGYFDTRGWFHYYQALKNSGNLQKVIEDKITVNATPLAPPTVLWKGLDFDVYKWRVQVPILVQYQFASGKMVEQKLMVNLSLRRTPASLGKDGIGIERFVAKPI